MGVAAGGRHNVFLTAQPASNGAGGLEFVAANVPTLVATHWLREVNADLLSELNMAARLRSKAIELSGASSTPLGAPSEPLVNMITAASSPETELSCLVRVTS